MKNVLVLDDDERLVLLLVELLETSGFNVSGVTSAAAARSKMQEQRYDAVIVDWMMPNEDGIDFMKTVRNSAGYYHEIPAIMLTAVDGIDQKIHSFESGFDDYITKPFEARELIARLNALIKRANKKNQLTVLEFGNCTFNINTGELKLGKDLIFLSSTELSLLKTLCQRPNEPYSRSELAKKLSFQVSDRTIDVQITRLRKKIGDNPKFPSIIKTVRYIGYALCCK